MHVDVVGGAGFIGTRLVERLQRHGVATRILDKVQSARFPLISVRVDVRNLKGLKLSLSRGAVLVNLAAEHRDDVKPVSLYDEVNVDGAKNICAAARELSVEKIVFTSSVAVYGFARDGTDESGVIAPFNDYGRTKYEAEQVYRAWQRERPGERSLVILRPTVVFGEGNRGNVYNLLRQVVRRRFVMIGSGANRKSMAYVENVAAAIEHSLSFVPGVHVFNFVDKPDYSMSQLVAEVNSILGHPRRRELRIPTAVGYAIGFAFDAAARLTGRRFAISQIRVKKFCSNSVFASSIASSGYVAPISLANALKQTIEHEFLSKDPIRATADEVVGEP
jgi:GlcNAc-P-P-Und epimerase